ncbi:hypothetical protein [Niabella hibiscisoli]|nr:hypothetical protein [Niabella hibiscisoli]MCH5716799.1 hypothetical protein [Niabella hibiscisoli]
MEHKLIAYFEQTLDTSEQKEVEQWIAESTEHKKYTRIRLGYGKAPV